ncbi:hypothetical protein AGLY_014121 [Aphis glycines]|uniref:Uncharacterized protein n=1 Tax=Aphis glycines TaxID=307491 RepID=A0A6G0T464_APHGL|nr:hypothetical protein AGLY_014121 [Aphis glycines]
MNLLSKNENRKCDFIFKKEENYYFIFIILPNLLTLLLSNEDIFSLKQYQIIWQLVPTILLSIFKNFNHIKALLNNTYLTKTLFYYSPEQLAKCRYVGYRSGVVVVLDPLLILSLLNFREWHRMTDSVSRQSRSDKIRPRKLATPKNTIFMVRLKTFLLQYGLTYKQITKGFLIRTK